MEVRRGSIAEEVKQRLALPVHQVGTHTVRQQRAKHIEMFQKITLAPGDDSWYANACLEEQVEQFPLSERADCREGVGETRGSRILSDAAHGFVILPATDADC
jgi:hypothetical protein